MAILALFVVVFFIVGLIADGHGKDSAGDYCVDVSNIFGGILAVATLLAWLIEKCSWPH